MATDANKIIPTRYKVIRRFYEPLLLLHALGPIRGGRTKAELVSENIGINHTQLRRSFADAIAYICAYKKGPDYVTAAALEKTPQGVVVWLAANSEIGEGVVVFLDAVLAHVRDVVDKDGVEDRQQTAQLATEKLSSMITDFHMPRLEVYRTKIIDHLIQPCQEVLAEYYKENVFTKDKDTFQIDNLQGWLTKYFGSSNEGSSQLSFLDLVNACYQIRHTQLLRTISLFSAQGRTRAQEFEQLYKRLGKLGKPIVNSRTLIEGAMKLSQDLNQGFTVKSIPSSKLSRLPIRSREETKIKSIVGRMFSTQLERDDFMERLRYLEGEKIDDFIEKEKSTSTRVHAELLLINHFERIGCNFLDSYEKYIGCSKPACYLCHMYIAQHPGRYVVPPCHNKLYLNWRAPDVLVGDTSGTISAAAQEKILLKMIEIVRKDLFAEILSRDMRRPFHADSTTGITSTLDSVPVDGSLSPQDTYPDDQEESATDGTYTKQVAEFGILEELDSDGGVPI